MKHIKQYNTFEDYDYFYPGDDKFCMINYTEKIYFIVSDTEFLAIGNIETYSKKRYIDWEIDNFISTPHKMTLSRIDHLLLDVIITTISDNDILKIKNLTGFDLTNYIRYYNKHKKATKFNL